MNKTPTPKFEIVDIDTVVNKAVRRGYAAELYNYLVTLHKERPDKKMVIQFTSWSSARQCRIRMAKYAQEDGYTLMYEPVKNGGGNTAMWVVKSEEEQ